MVDTVSVAVIAALVGSLATGVVNYIVREYRRSKREKEEEARYRRALYSEIQAGIYGLPNKTMTDAAESIVSTTIFENSPSNIGLLTEKEASAVISYYTSAKRLNGLSKRIANDQDKIELAQNMERVPEAHLFDEYVKQAVDGGNEALEVLSENIESDTRHLSTGDWS